MAGSGGFNRDILVIAASFVVVNLIVDLLYAVINPRIKLS